MGDSLTAMVFWFGEGKLESNFLAEDCTDGARCRLGSCQA